MRLLPIALFLATVYSPVTVSADAESMESLAEAIENHLDFADYPGGVVMPQQIVNGEWKDYLLIDTRTAERFEQGHLPNAIRIEWRELPARRDELPRDQPLLLYCDTGMLSAQAHFALKLLGWSNSRVLQGGYAAWTAEGAPTTTTP